MMHLPDVEQGEVARDDEHDLRQRPFFAEHPLR